MIFVLVVYKVASLNFVIFLVFTILYQTDGGKGVAMLSSPQKSF